MTCSVFRHRGGGTSIICHGRGRRVKPKPCAVCGRPPATLECDGKNPKHRSGTCDKLLCEKCAVRAGDQVLHQMPGKDRMADVVDTIDYCPDCAKAVERAARAPKQGSLF